MNLGRVAFWPLRPLGLDPGRAVANARPSAAALYARRTEQLQYIVRDHPLPEGSEPVRISR